MRDAYLDKEISFLAVDEKILDILKQNSIINIRDVWKLKRTDFKKMGLSDSQVNNIIIKLQLNGLDINGKIYKKI